MLKVFSCRCQQLTKHVQPMARISQLLRTCSPMGLIRYLRMLLMGRELLITGSCHCCGNCCKKINLEGVGGWLRSERDFYEVLREHPEYERFQVIGKDAQGFVQFSCTWLTTEGLCRDHTKRLALCMNFPDKSLHFCGGQLPAGCGYSIDEVRPFDKYLEDEVKGMEKR